MSVINQMLKDLDDRQSEQQGDSSTHMPMMPKNTSHKNLIIIVLVLVLLNVIGFLAWKLYGNDDNLAGQSQLMNNSAAPHVQPQQALAENNHRQNTVSAEASLSPQVRSNAVVIPGKASAPEVSKDNDNVSVVEHPHPHQVNAAEAITPEEAQPEMPKAVLSERGVVERQVKAVKTSKESHVEETPPAGSFSISRKKLSPKVLIAQKISRAESAIDKNQISKAESLLEEVLLLDPKQVDSRKKLAALWFGREAFQDAVSLINQGINITPNDSELRLMKARIYLQKERPDRAYTSLKGFTQTDDIEYLALLATLAEQLNELPMAIDTYQRLTQLQPELGKWWLGLAIALDRNSDFKGALKAYKNAIAQDDMSRGSTAFAKKRMSELGE